MKNFIVLFSLCASLLQAGYVVTQVDGASYEGFYTAEQEGLPLVVILHDWDGLTDYEMKRAVMLREQGYAVMAADLFGQGVRPTEVADKRQHTGELYQDREKMRTLIAAAIQEAGQQGADTSRTVVLGYCFGGAAALEASRAGMDLKGVASFHGGLSTPEGQSYETTTCPVMVFHGTADTIISMEDVAQIATELEAAKVPHEVISYGGAPHSFTVFNKPAYRAAPDLASWNRLLRFLAQQIGTK